MKEDYIEFKVNEENHTTLIGKCEEIPPFDKKHIAELFMNFSKRILQGKDIDFIDIKSYFKISQTSNGIEFIIQIDIWEKDEENEY